MLKEGSHTIRVLADGSEFAHGKFTVVSLGEEFLQRSDYPFTVPDFPYEGSYLTLEWRPSIQNFTIKAVRHSDAYKGPDSDASVTQFSELAEGRHLHRRDRDPTYFRKSTEVFRTQAGFETAFAYYTNEPAPNIDFSANRVLLVDMGQRATGGYRIQVTSVETNEDSVTAKVRLYQPGDRCAVTQAVTHPFQFVRVETIKELLVHERLVTRACE